MDSIDSKLVNKNGRELYLEIEVNGLVVYVSSNIIDVLGYEKQFILGKNINEFTQEPIKLNIEKSGCTHNICVPFINKDRQITYMDIEYSIQYGNKEKKINMSMIDVTKYVKQEEKLKRVLQIVEKSNDIIYSFDIKPEPHYVYLSPAIERNLGYSLDENKINPFLVFDVVHPDYYNIQIDKLKGDIDSNKTIISRYKHKSTGEYIWFEDYCIPVYNEFGELIRLDGICRNIQDRKELEEKLKYLSYHDALTGLYNRTYFEEKMKELNEDFDTKVGIIICDLDNLKYINDKLGHFEGDNLIREIGSIISDRFKEKYVASRFGGDEFVIILEGIEYEELKREVNGFKSIIKEHNINTKRFPIHVSLGFAYSENSKGNIFEIFKKADKNMFKEKIKTKDVNLITNYNL